MRGPAWITAGAAAALAGLAWIGFKVLVHQAPWMTGVAVVGDMGEQSVPFMAYYRDVLTGQANGDLLFAWGMSYGQSFVGTFAQYLSNPFNLVVVLFPRTQAPQAIFAVQILMGAATAASMSMLLSSLRPGWWSLNVVLAVAWATLPFITLDASYHPYWGVGALVLPLMVQSALWVSDGRHAWHVVPLFGMAFLANFYTAYMATLGAGLIVITLMVAHPELWTRPGRTIVAWAARAAVGVGLAAVLIVPAYFAVRQSAMPEPPPFEPGRLADWAAGALPGADTITRAPSWSPALPVLVLLLIALAAGHRRVRAAWLGAVSAVLVTMAVEPTAIVWHGGDVPDGNFFRQAWVAAGIVVIAVWQMAPDLADGVRRARGWLRPAEASAAALAGLAVAAASATVVEPAAAVLGGVLTLGTAAVVMMRGLDRAWGHVVLLALVLVGLGIGQVGATDRFMARASVIHRFDWLADQAPLIDAALAAGRGSSAGLSVPVERTMNDPLLLGGVGLTGYSTMMPRRSVRLAELAGATVRGGGRRVFTAGTPLEHATFGAMDPGAPAAERPQARWVDAARFTPASDGRIDTPLEFYAAHLGADVRAARVAGEMVAGSWEGQAACPGASSVLYADSTRMSGRLSTDGATIDLPPRDAWLGRVTAVAEGSGPWPVVIDGPAADDSPALLFCAPARPQAVGHAAGILRFGHEFTVAGSGRPGDDLLVATPYTPEWECQRGDEPATTYDHAGLLVVRAGGQDVSCAFVPRGFVAGLAVTGLSLLLFAAMLLMALRGPAARRS